MTVTLIYNNIEFSLKKVVCPTVCLSFRPCSCPSIGPTVFPFIYMSIRPLFYVSIFLSVRAPVFHLVRQSRSPPSYLFPPLSHPASLLRCSCRFFGQSTSQKRGRKCKRKRRRKPRRKPWFRRKWKRNRLRRRTEFSDAKKNSAKTSPS